MKSSVYFEKLDAVKLVPPPSCPLLRRTISCLAPMLPSMASSSLAFMSLDFLKVKLFILSNAFFPCMVNTTWALYPRGRGRNDREHGGKVICSTALSEKVQVSRGEETEPQKQAKRKTAQQKRIEAAYTNYSMLLESRKLLGFFQGI